MRNTKKNDRPTFARNVILRRFDAGISGEELAERSGVPYPTLAKIEGGFSAGRPATKEKIAKALGTTVDELNTPGAAQRTQDKPTENRSKSEILGRLMEVLPALNEAQLAFILSGIEQINSPIIDALVLEHTQGKREQA